MNSTFDWFAVYTKPRWEKKVAELLTRKGIQNYCPLNKVLKQWHDRKKYIDEPLFTSYVFVCVPSNQHVDVRKTDGIINFVYWLGKPALIKEHEIETIRDFLSAYREVKLEKANIKPLDTVQIINGPLMHREGQVLEVYQKTVKVMLPSLGYAMVAQVEKANVEVVKAPEKKKEHMGVPFNSYKIA